MTYKVLCCTVFVLHDFFPLVFIFLLMYLSFTLQEATGYQRNIVKLVLTTLATVLSGGLLLLPLTWRPSFRLPLTHTRCPLAQATTVLLKVIL